MSSDALNSAVHFARINSLLAEISKLPKDRNDKYYHAAYAIDLANEIMKMVIGINGTQAKKWSDSLVKNVAYTGQLPHAFTADIFRNQKQASWYNEHPNSSSSRFILKLFSENDAPFEAKFYWLNESATRARMAATTNLTPNWEDSDLTRNPSHKVSIDFFLRPDTRAVLVVLKNYEKLRVLELEGLLSNTQKMLLEKISGAGDVSKIEIKTAEEKVFEPQRTIHTTLWNAFELKEVNKHFFIEIATFFERMQRHLVDIVQKDEQDAKMFACKLLGRLLFCWFLRKKEFINEDLKYFEAIDLSSTQYYEKQLKMLFFGTLNTPISERKHSDNRTPYLNGGLFEAISSDFPEEKLELPDGWFHELYLKFDEYNFTTDESSSEYEQVAVDPEMLGRVFENLLAQLVNETGESARKSKGAFYTPREIVDYMCKESLRQFLYTKGNQHVVLTKEISLDKLRKGIDDLLDLSNSEFLVRKTTSKVDFWGEKLSDKVIEMIRQGLQELKVLDPACGSGAFPMGMLQLMMKVYERIHGQGESKSGNSASVAKFDAFEIKKHILHNSIYGVDIEPMAVEISRLRFWLSLIVDETNIKKVEPFPNLDFKFVCANSLLPLVESEKQGILFEDVDIEKKMLDLREKWFEAYLHQEKNQVKEKWKELTCENKVGDMNAEAERTKQLKTWNPFDQSIPAKFFDTEYMFGVDKFDIVIGNPPYVGEKGNKEIFDVLKQGDLGKRFYLGKMDLLYFFFHLGIDALKDDGVLSFITTNYYPTADGAKKLRQDFKNRADILKLINFNELTIFDSAKGQHDMITLLSRRNKKTDTTQIVANIKANISSNELNKVLSGSDEFTTVANQSYERLYDGEKYYIRFAANNDLELLLDKIASNGVTLGSLAQVNQGIVSGADKVSNRHLKKYPDIKANKGDPIFVYPRGKLQEIGDKSDPIVPFYKNSDITRWTIKKDFKKELLYANGEKELSPGALLYLERFKPILKERREFQDGKRPWYSIHRGRVSKIFNDEKIVVPQRSYVNTFGYTNLPWYASADVYFITNSDKIDVSLKFLLGVLNSQVMFLWLYNRGKRKGEMLELLQNPLSEIPIRRNSKLESEISNLSDRIVAQKHYDLDSDISMLEYEINQLVYQLYNLTNEEITLVEDFAKKQKP